MEEALGSDPGGAGERHAFRCLPRGGGKAEPGRCGVPPLERVAAHLRSDSGEGKAFPRQVPAGMLPGALMEQLDYLAHCELAVTECKIPC